MTFAATDFEFRQRIWIFFLIFWIAFFLYIVDHVNLAAALGELIARHVWGASRHVDGIVQGVLFVGFAIGACAALVRTWAAAYLRSSVVHDTSLHSDLIVADGPYRHLRNPLYLGTILIGAGVGTLASRAGFVFLVVCIYLFVLRLILREEAALLQSQGESYRRYYAAVPRLIPSLRPRVPASGAKPNWADGFNGELFMWGFVASLAVFAITERLSYFWIVFGANLVFITVRESLRRRRARDNQAA